jgi:hypothetical protein
VFRLHDAVRLPYRLRWCFADAGVQIVGAGFGSLTLAHRLRWCLADAGVQMGAGVGSLTLAHRLRWCFADAGVQIVGAGFGSLTLAHRLRWCFADAWRSDGKRNGAKFSTSTLLQIPKLNEIGGKYLYVPKYHSARPR